MKLAKKCQKIYEKSGAVAVINYCNQVNHNAWESCQACDCLSPLENGNCLICGQTVIDNEIVDTKKVSIETKYISPSNIRGARIVAVVTCSKIKISIPYDHSLNHEDAHNEAAKALCRKMNWSGRLAKGATKTGYVFVFLD